MTELVHRHDSAAIATITLDSPTNRNALSRQLVRELHTHLTEAISCDDVRAIVLTGNGPVFCAGADLKERRAGGAVDPDAPKFIDILDLIMSAPKPIITKMNGPARAGGVGIVAASDIAIAPTNATFAFSEVRIGVAPAMIGVPCVRRMTSRSVSRYFLTGETFDAATAVDAGLVTMAVDDVDAAGDEIMDAFRLASPAALASAKGLIEAAGDGTPIEALLLMEKESARMFALPEAQEGMRAFAEKRSPSWAVSIGG